MIKIAIVENEQTQIEIIFEMIKKYCNTNDIQFDILSFNNGYDFLENDISTFDLFFMDIDMPGINGMETSAKIRSKGITTPLIFVTNLPQFAIDGYKVQALDFILKPMTYADFSLAMKRALVLINQDKIGDFILNIHGSLIKFKQEEILYIDMIKHDVNLHLSNGEIKVFRSSLNKIEPLLNDKIYLKCNSGCIVNLNKVKRIEKDILIMENDDHITISRSRKKETLSKFNGLLSLMDDSTNE